MRAYKSDTVILDLIHLIYQLIQNNFYFSPLLKHVQMSVTLNGIVANIVEVTQNKYVHRVLHTSREEKTIYTYMKSHWYYGNLFSRHSSETVEEIKLRGGAYSADNFFFTSVSLNCHTISYTDLPPVRLPTLWISFI